MKSLPVTADRVRRSTETDKILSKVQYFVLNGWPCREEISPELRMWLKKKDELTVESGCLLWGTRVIIPEGLQHHILEELHRGHQGMVKMKSLARMHVYWIGLDQDIEQLVQSCKSCQSMQSVLPAAPVNPWAWPSQPWHRVHIDFAGPF